MPKDHAEIWDKQVKNNVKMLQNFYNEMFKIYRERNVPVYFVKYEEMLAEPKATLRSIFKFLLNEQNINGTVIEKRINEVIEQGKEGTHVYKMKKENPLYPKSEDWFTEEQKEFVLSKLFDQLEFFGYFKKDGKD